MNRNCSTKTNLENVIVTDKAAEEIQHPSKKLTLRERQLLIMLASDSHYCDSNPEGHELYCDMCDNLMNKVNLGSLVNKGYLSLKPGTHLIDNRGNPIDTSKDEAANDHTENVNKANDEEPEVFLRVVSGNF